MKRLAVPAFEVLPLMGVVIPDVLRLLLRGLPLPLEGSLGGVSPVLAFGSAAAADVPKADVGLLPDADEDAVLLSGAVFLECSLLGPSAAAGESARLEAPRSLVPWREAFAISAAAAVGDFKPAI